MWLAEPYPTSPSSPVSGIQDQVTAYLSGLVPAGAVDSGIAAVFAVTTVILAALGWHHFRSENCCSGWVSGPSAVLASFIAAFYASSGLPTFAGVDAHDASNPRNLFVAVVVALLAAALVAGAAWPVAAHLSAYRGSPTTLADLREWVLVDRLPAAGGAALGGALAWIAVDPLLCAAGAVLGLLVTVTVVTLRAPAIPDVRPEQPRPAAVPQEHRPPRAPVPPVVSDEDW